MTPQPQPVAAAATQTLTATRQQLGNDLYWNARTPHRMPGGGQRLSWVGYNDSDWWNIHSKQAHVADVQDEMGRVWRLDFQTNQVTLLA